MGSACGNGINPVWIRGLSLHHLPGMHLSPCCCFINRNKRHIYKKYIHKILLKLAMLLLQGTGGGYRHVTDRWQSRCSVHYGKMCRSSRDKHSMRTCIKQNSCAEEIDQKYNERPLKPVQKLWLLPPSCANFNGSCRGGLKEGYACPLEFKNQENSVLPCIIFLAVHCPVC